MCACLETPKDDWLIIHNQIMLVKCINPRHSLTLDLHVINIKRAIRGSGTSESRLIL